VAVRSSSSMHEIESGGVVIVITSPAGEIHSTAHAMPPRSTLVFASKNGPAEPGTRLPAPPPMRESLVDPTRSNCRGGGAPGAEMQNTRDAVTEAARNMLASSLTIASACDDEPITGAGNAPEKSGFHIDRICVGSLALVAVESMGTSTS
jgi:hypothetical protein